MRYLNLISTGKCIKIKVEQKLTRIRFCKVYSRRFDAVPLVSPDISKTAEFSEIGALVQEIKNI